MSVTGNVLLMDSSVAGCLPAPGTPKTLASISLGRGLGGPGVACGAGATGVRSQEGPLSPWKREVRGCDGEGPDRTPPPPGAGASLSPTQQLSPKEKPEMD